MPSAKRLARAAFVLSQESATFRTFIVVDGTSHPYVVYCTPEEGESVLTKVAKPWLLRADERNFELDAPMRRSWVVDGRLPDPPEAVLTARCYYPRLFGGAPGVYDQREVLGIQAGSGFEYIQPPYRVGDRILAVSYTEQMGDLGSVFFRRDPPGVTFPFETISWIDLNIDKRAWTTLSTAVTENADP